MKNPQSLGAAHTAYVLWAVAPEGRAENLAELPVSRHFQLSEDRARSVATYLRQTGISGARIVRVQGFAETQPVASNDTAAGRQRNSRVEL
ncbi:MAG TPA: OmpA family protein [Vicinamibacteria bacterium]|nr:OmpA family protein [Vicinamibacteria bacterium]